MRYFKFLILGLLLTACGYRGIPPEISALHDKPKPTLPKREEVIVVDAGHGGKDSGTNSKLHDYAEKQLTLETALLVCESLKALGYKTVLTRSDDTFVSLDARAEMANTLNADLFVSVHYNHCGSEEAEGVEVYYYKEGKTPQSERILCSKELGREVLKTIICHTKAESRGVKQANFAVVRQTKMPAVLIEAGFLSNPKERQKIKSHHYKKSLALGIAHGVDHYLGQKRSR